MDASGTPNQVTPPDHKLRRLRELALNFLKIGATAFGGPPAHIAMMEEEFVGRRGWLDHQRFLDLIGAVNLLPGPNSTELALYIGLLRAGWLGLMVAGAAFILPSATLVLALAWAYVRFGALPQVAGVLYGTKPVVIVVVAQALWALGRTAIKSRLLAVVVLLNLALLVAGVHAVVLLLGRPRPGGPACCSIVCLVRNRLDHSRGDKCCGAIFLLHESRGAALRKRIPAAGVSARRPGGESALADRDAASRRHRRQPGDAGPALHGGDFYRLRAGRLAGGGFGDDGGFSARVSACGDERMDDPAPSPITADGGLS